jgi:hypothetical protein
LLRHAKPIIRLHFLGELGCFSEEGLSIGLGNHFLNMLDLALDFLLQVIFRDCEVESVSLLIKCVPLLDEGVLPVALVVNYAICFESLLEILSKHEKFTWSQLFKTGLLFDVISPESILVAEPAFVLGFLAVFAIVLALFPWVLHFQKSDHGAIGVSVFYKRFDNNALACLEALELIEALSGNHMLLPQIEGERVPELIRCRCVGFVVLRWRACEESSCLR